MPKHAKSLFILMMILTQNLQTSQINYSESLNSDSIANLLAIINKIKKESYKTESNISSKNNLKKIINSNIVPLFGPQVIDGFKLIEKDIILLIGQKNKSENGLWIVQNTKWVPFKKEPVVSNTKINTKNNEFSSNQLDESLEFISPNEQNYITKAGGGNVTVENFSAADLIVKTDGSTLGVTGSEITVDSSNNLSGVNTISTTGISLPTTSVSNPAIKFPGTNTGIYSEFQDQISIGSQGTNIITFGSTGTTIPSNLAIGSPTLFNNTATFANTANFNSTGTTNITGQLNITGTANFNGATNTLSGTLNLNGTTNITGATLSGPTYISGTTTMSGITNITNQMTISSPSTVSNINLSSGGSQTSPAITFNSDTSSGIYSPAVKNISISTAGTQKLNIYETGISATGLSMSGDINMNSSNNITGATILSCSTLNCTNSFNTSGANINGTLNVTGTTNLNGPLNVTGATIFADGLTTAGTVNLNGTVSATGISMSGDISMTANNVTGANTISATGLYLQPGTATSPSLNFNGNTGVGLSCTSANTLNLCGGSTGINAKISPSGLNILQGSLNLSYAKTLSSGTINLDDPYSIYFLTGNSFTYTASSGTSLTGKIVILANCNSGVVSVTITQGSNVPPITLTSSKGFAMCVCTNTGTYKWAVIPM